MSQEKLRDFAIVFWVGLFLLTFQPVFLWLLAGSLVLFSGKSCSRAEKRGVHRRMKLDAKENELHVPRQRHLRDKMIMIYEKRERAVADYPHLKQNYDDVIDEMWFALGKKKTVKAWDEVLSTVLAKWPTAKPSETKKSGISEKLDELNRATQQWNEARKEAFGGPRV